MLVDITAHSVGGREKWAIGMKAAPPEWRGGSTCGFLDTDNSYILGFMKKPVNYICTLQLFSFTSEISREPVQFLYAFRSINSSKLAHLNSNTENIYSFCMCVMCFWVNFDSWWPYECPQCPVLNSPSQLLEIHSYDLFAGINTPHIWSPSFPAVFYCFLALLSSPKNPVFSGCSQSKTASVLSLLHPAIS